MHDLLLGFVVVWLAAVRVPADLGRLAAARVVLGAALTTFVAPPWLKAL